MSSDEESWSGASRGVARESRHRLGKVCRWLVTGLTALTGLTGLMGLMGLTQLSRGQLGQSTLQHVFH